MGQFIEIRVILVISKKGYMFYYTVEFVDDTASIIAEVEGQ